MAKKIYSKEYETWGGRELKAVINGKVCGVKKDRGKSKSYFWREPQQTGKAKKRNLGRDKGKAASKWWAIVEANMREQLQPLPPNEVKSHKKLRFVQRPSQSDGEFDALVEQAHQLLAKGENETVEEWKERVWNNPRLSQFVDRIEYFVPEKVLVTIFNRWLEDPYECSRKLGREDIANLHKISPKDPIPLSKMGDYYFDYVPTDRPQASEKERKKVKKWFDQFVRITNKTYLDDIRQSDVADYTQTIMKLAKQKGRSNTWISHRWAAVKTVIGVYSRCLEDKIEVDRVLRIWHDFRSPGKGDFSPTRITKQQLKQLLAKVNIKWKAMILWSLNTCSYPVDVRFLRTKNINWKDGTISYRRKKTGVPKCGVLWRETLEAISEYQEERKSESEYLFLSSFKTHYSEGGFSDYVRTYIRPKVKWHFTFGQIRDSARYAAEKAGISPNHIYIAMGHRIRSGQDDAYLLRHAELVEDVSKAIHEYYFSERKHP